MKRLLLTVFTCVLLVLPKAQNTSYTIQSVPNPQTKNERTYVSNPNGILSTQTELYLNKILDSIEIRTTAEIAVVAIQSIEDEDVNHFANQLFSHWGIGKKQKDNGLLILFVLDQRAIKFETGYGLEGVLPDAICKRIQINEMIPYFKLNQFDKGMIAGINKVSLILTNPSIADEIKAETTQKFSAQKIISYYLYASAFLFILILIFSISKNKRISDLNNYTKYQETTIFYNFLKFGSFIFPLALLLFFIQWKFLRKRMRTSPINCPACNEKMKRLSEKEEDCFLNKKEITEEQIKSIDYDVWICNACGKKKILAYDNIFAKHKKCPKCGAKTFAEIENRIILQATTFNSGIGEKISECEHCRFQVSKEYHIPKIIVASGSGKRGGGIGGNFGGGFSGGGGAISRF